MFFFFEGEFPVLQSGEDVLTTPSKIMDYLREKVCGLFIRAGRRGKCFLFCNKI